VEFAEPRRAWPGRLRGSLCERGEQHHRKFKTWAWSSRKKGEQRGDLGGVVSSPVQADERSRLSNGPEFLTVSPRRARSAGVSSRSEGAVMTSTGSESKGTCRRRRCRKRWRTRPAIFGGKDSTGPCGGPGTGAGRRRPKRS